MRDDAREACGLVDVAVVAGALEHDKAGHTVSMFLAVWDGAQLVDAGAGYAGNEDLAARLLGFRPGRHVPADAGNVLAINAGPDDDDEADEDLE